MQLSELRTKQDVFDFVLEKIREQGRPSIMDYACRYRSSDGAKCAVGHLISDDQYCEEIEYETPEYLVEGHKIRFPFPAEEKGWLKFLDALQDAHDFPGALHSRVTGYNFRQGFEDRMVSVARQFGLAHTPPSAT